MLSVSQFQTAAGTPGESATRSDACVGASGAGAIASSGESVCGVGGSSNPFHFKPAQIEIKAFGFGCRQHAHADTQPRRSIVNILAVLKVDRFWQRLVWLQSGQNLSETLKLLGWSSHNLMRDYQGFCYCQQNNEIYFRIKLTMNRGFDLLASK